MEENKLVIKLPILSKKETIKNFLFDEFYKGLGVGLVSAAFFYGCIKVISNNKQIEENKKIINALTLITVVLPTVKNFYTYRKFTTGEDVFFNSIKLINQSYYVIPDPLKVLAMRILKLSIEDQYDFIFALLQELSLQAVKKMRNNMHEKAFFLKDKQEIDKNFNLAIQKHFLNEATKLKCSEGLSQKDYDSIIKFFLLGIDNIKENTETINKLINTFKAEKAFNFKKYEYHTFEKVILHM